MNTIPVTAVLAEVYQKPRGCAHRRHWLDSPAYQADTEAQRQAKVRAWCVRHSAYYVKQARAVFSLAAVVATALQLGYAAVVVDVD